MGNKGEAGATQARRRRRERDDELKRALIRRADPAELEALTRAGSRAGLDALTAAAGHGSAEGLSWALERAVEAQEPGARRSWKTLSALWRCAEFAAKDPQKVGLLIKALGLPRALAAEERPLALKALSKGARSSEASFGLWLDAVEPLEESDSREGTPYYLSAAAGGGAAALRRALDHPVHGPRMTPERQGAALRSVLDSGWGGEERGLEAIQALFLGAELGEPGRCALALAAERGRSRALEWMLAQGGERVSLGRVKVALRVATAARVGGTARETLSGWIRAREERDALEEAAEPAAARAPRLRV